MFFTFYSYKGGVGRTMALANIAELLYAKGANVLMIDWDLESPGLDTYFPHISQEAKEHFGLLDMLTHYKHHLINYPPPPDDDPWPFPEVSNYWIDVYPSSETRNAGSLRLISAGRRDGEQFAEYAEKVKKFDWEDFLDNWAGERYLSRLKQRVENFSDVILVDSRSGVNEVSGICTRHLADVVIAFTSLNTQSMEGTAQVVKSLEADTSLDLAQDNRPSNIVVVPARVEQSAELIMRNRAERQFKERFDVLIPSQWRENGRSLWELAIPYVPLYAFEEIVSVREERNNGEKTAAELVKAYEDLWEAMIDFAQGLQEDVWHWRTESGAVLLVEDSTDWQQVLEEIVVKTGAKCEKAETLPEALALLEDIWYKLVILNLNLSAGQNFEGVDILNFLKGTRKAIPVVIVTGITINTLDTFRRFDNVVNIFFKGAQFDRKSLERIITEYLVDGPENAQGLYGRHIGPRKI